MTRRSIGIIVNGVTGRMGYRQHLVRSLLAIRSAGGVPLADGTTVWPHLVLVGRSEPSCARSLNDTAWTTGPPT